MDPFAGAGTVPLEAVIRKRRAFGSDISPYARILSTAKLAPPSSEADAVKAAHIALDEAMSLPAPDLRSVPLWVRRFFHPETLREALRFAKIARRSGNEFLMACFLGILHHQRPGFLSYPSSHLVPYLRSNKYPPELFADMYAYRELKPRLLSKISRSFKRFQMVGKGSASFKQGDVGNVCFPNAFDAVITSPPYMNALDYGRDNRLRLWFIEPNLAATVDNDVTVRLEGFLKAITSFAEKIEVRLKPKGYCVFVVGEEHQRSFKAHPSNTILAIINEKAPSLRLIDLISDNIPDIRRARRECKGVKSEHFLIFQKS